MPLKLHKFFALSPADQWLHARCLVLVALIRVGLNTLTLERVRQRLDRWINRPGRGSATVDDAEIARVTKAVEHVSRLVPHATCLTQALATQAMLGRAGCKTHLRLGVRRSQESGEFQAHAWIEHAGRVLIGGNEQSLAQYTMLPALD